MEKKKVGSGLPNSTNAAQCVRRERGKYGTDIYERKKDTAAGGVHVPAHGAVHGGERAVQYHRQLFCSKGKRRRHDCFGACISRTKPD